MRQMTRGLIAGILAMGLMLGCDKGKENNAAADGGRGGGSKNIVVDGSDTMVNLSEAWAEAYKKGHPGVDFQVKGGGAGVGSASRGWGRGDLGSVGGGRTREERAGLKDGKQ